jgi:hypothetical protein
VRRLLDRVSFSDAQRRHIARLLDAWEDETR